MVSRISKIRKNMRNVVFALSLISHGAGAAELFGAVDAVSGSASVAGQDGQSGAVSVGMKLYEGDTITSAHDGEVHIVTEDGGIIALRPDTVFRVDQYKAEGGADDKTFMSLLAGAVRSVTGWIGKHDHAAYRLTTPTAIIGIRGTDHEVAVIDQGAGDEPGTYETVNEGATVMKTPHGDAEVAPGKFAFAARGGAAAPKLLAQRPRFLAARRLSLEGRFLQRKEFMRDRLEQMRVERIKYKAPVERGLGERGAGLPDRPHATERPGEQAPERREDARGQAREGRERRQELARGGREPGRAPPRRRKGRSGREHD